MKKGCCVLALSQSSRWYGSRITKQILNQFGNMCKGSDRVLPQVGGQIVDSPIRVDVYQ